jgi:hypothetical protein
VAIIHTKDVPSLDFIKTYVSHGIALVIGFWPWMDYVELVTANKLPFYQYTPDATFSTLIPKRIAFPPHNKDEWQKGVFTTDADSVELTKVHMKGLADVNPQIERFVRQFSVSEPSINTMLVRYNVDYDATQSACEWLLANEVTWSSWVPDATACLEGQGLFYTEANIPFCGLCEPGRKHFSH